VSVHWYRYAPPACEDVDEMERKYWKNVAFNPPIYGADISGTLFDSDQDVWNLNNLGTILDCVNEDYGVKVRDAKWLPVTGSKTVCSHGGGLA